MARWAPGSRERLSTAALDLFAEQGYDETTTAQIAHRAGLTERTFYRHFDDKREALFSGQESFVRGFLDAVAAAPADVTPGQVVAAALDGSAAFFDDRLDHSRRRDAVIAAHPGLQERELLKLAALTRAVAGAMCERGVPEPAATLAAETCVTVFRVAFDRWLAGGSGDPGGDGAGVRPLLDVQREVLAELSALTASSWSRSAGAGRRRRSVGPCRP